jgi:glutamate synthase (NADPH/NADH) small chain
LDYLSESTRALLEGRDAAISAAGKDVAVIGGGDTGVDCVATALRQGARSVRQVIRANRPPDEVDTVLVWPAARTVYAQAYGQREAAELFGADPRLWSTDTVGFAGSDGRVSAVQVRPMRSEEEPTDIPAQLVLIAKGFTGPEQPVLDAFASCRNVHLAGDARLGSTLVASAIADGLRVAGAIAGGEGLLP